MFTFEVGEAVRLVPTQGCHQKEKSGLVTRVTAKQVAVRSTDSRAEVMYRLSDGLPVRKYDQQFPCYALRPQN